MSASLNVASDWNFRLLEKRLVTVKTKNEGTRTIAVIDVLTNLLFTVNAQEAIDISKLETDTEYIFNLNVYTSKNIDNVKEDFVSFFEALDVDQDIEDFIKAYWVYPTKIRFELIEIEET